MENKKLSLVSLLLLLLVVSCATTSKVQQSADLDDIAKSKVRQGELKEVLKTVEVKEKSFSKISEHKSVTADVLRIVESIDISWSGVSNCPSSVDAETKKYFDAWVGRKMKEHQNLRWKSYGHDGGNYRCTQYRDIDGTRYCGCRGGIKKAYIEFWK